MTTRLEGYDRHPAFTSQFATDLEAAEAIMNDPNRSEFAESMALKARANRLSTKTRYWLHKTAPQPPAPVTKTGRSFPRIVALMSTDKLKRPAITIHDLKLTRATDRARFPGSINVVVDGVFLGRLHKDDARLELVRCDELPDHVLDYLEAFENDPVEFAQSYGRQTSNCCFCTKRLTDPRSVIVGYGPVCAKNYSLPWGTSGTPSLLTL